MGVEAPASRFLRESEGYWPEETSLMAYAYPLGLSSRVRVPVLHTALKRP